MKFFDNYLGEKGKNNYRIKKLAKIDKKAKK